jgi:DNA-binding CsgD family transcriptional regulator
MLGDELKLQNLQTTVDQAVLDPSKWVAVCDRLSDFIGGVGGSIVPDAADYLIPSMVVISPSLDDLVATIFRDGWLSRNYRRRSIPIIKERGFATDHDIADEHAFRTEPFYNELLAPHGMGTFVGLHLVTTTHTFIASVERASSAEPPDDEMFRRVDLVRPILSAGARASVAVGSLRLESWKDLSTDASRATFVLDYLGRVVDRNAASEALIGTVADLSLNTLRLLDPRADQQLERLIAATVGSDTAPLPRPVFARAPALGSVMFEALRLPPSLRFFHALGVALLVARPVEDTSGDLAEMLRRQGGLTTAELKVAMALFEGMSPSEYAESAGLSIGTVRQQIKSVYRKTGTGRQNELSALIRRLLDSSNN